MQIYRTSIFYYAYILLISIPYWIKVIIGYWQESCVTKMVIDALILCGSLNFANRSLWFANRWWSYFGMHRVLIIHKLHVLTPSSGRITFCTIDTLDFLRDLCYGRDIAAHITDEVYFGSSNHYKAYVLLSNPTLGLSAILNLDSLRDQIQNPKFSILYKWEMAYFVRSTPFILGDFHSYYRYCNLNEFNFRNLQEKAIDNWKFSVKDSFLSWIIEERPVEFGEFLGENNNWILGIFWERPFYYPDLSGKIC